MSTRPMRRAPPNTLKISLDSVRTVRSKRAASMGPSTVLGRDLAQSFADVRRERRRIAGHAERGHRARPRRDHEVAARGRGGDERGRVELRHSARNRRWYWTARIVEHRGDPVLRIGYPLSNCPHSPQVRAGELQTEV